jgi:PAS domain S-box-containing protein
LKTLRDLGARTTPVTTVTDACRFVVTALGENTADVPFSMIYLTDRDGKTAALCASSQLRAGCAACPELIDLTNTQSVAGWPLASAVANGGPIHVTDVRERFGELPGGPWNAPPSDAIVLPLRGANQERISAFLVAGLSSCRAFDDASRGFFELVAGQAAAALSDARAYEEERQRAEALAELDRAKTAFFANVSHEFRTPLTLMLGPAEDALAQASSPEQRERLELLHRNALRLQKLVNTLLDFTRIEAGRVQASYEPTDLAALTAELASVFRSAVEKAGMKLIVQCEPVGEPVFVDRDMWEKIVLNLVSNAFKFTLEGEIEVGLTREDSGATLIVRDTGSGISEEQLPHIFERFHRIEGTRARTHEGTGIGLSLVQELVRLHGGSIHVESAIGRGATFRVTIPLGRSHLPAERIAEPSSSATIGIGAHAYLVESLRWLPDLGVDDSRLIAALERSPALAGPTASVARPRILVADDNTDMREYVRRLLAGHYVVRTVADGQAALAVARSERPDLVLTDVMMPLLDGFGFLRELRADPQTATIPVIMLSARAGEEARVEGIQSGADDYLVKPFGARELLARVGAHIELARARRAAAAADERAAVILESITDAFFTLDAQWQFTYVNAEAERINGVRRGELLGKSHWEVFPATLGSIVEREFRHAVADQVAVEFENYYEPYQKWFGIRAYPARDRGLSVYFRDITDKKAAEAAKLARTEQLQKLLEENRRLYEELRENDKRKDEFLAMLAHELRNPLAAIGNAITVLKMSSGAEHVNFAKDVIERQVRQLVRLIDDLLDVARITSGKIHLKKEFLDTACVLAQAVESVRPLINERKHELITSFETGTLPIWADPTRIEQIVVNLLTNAAKYTESGGRIWLTARVEQPNVVISVRDNGIGIPPDKLPDMFQLFSQGERSIARSEGGLGIGLTIVRRLTEMHGGHVVASSEGTDRGSEFVIYLPIAQKARAARPAGLTTPNEMKNGSRILVVDDNADTAGSLARLLTLLGNEVQLAHHGKAAIEVAQAFRPDFVLLDIGLPGMDGYEVAAILKKESACANAVIVAVSGYGQDDDRRRAREAGFDHHLVKPIDFDALTKLLARL